MSLVSLGSVVGIVPWRQEATSPVLEKNDHVRAPVVFVLLEVARGVF